MASGNGSWGAPSATGNRLRLEWQTDQTPATVGTGTGSVTVRLRVWARVKYTATDANNSFSLTGHWSDSGSKPISITTSGGRQLISDKTITVSTVYGSAVTRSFSATFSGIEAVGGPASVSGSHTVPARPVSPPVAPTNVSVSRQSDTRHTIAWTHNGSSAAPYRSVVVQRTDFTASGWSGWRNVSGTLTGTAASWVDQGTVANRAYGWRVVAANESGSAASGSSGVVFTTPAPPTGVAAQKLSSGDIRVSWVAGQPFSPVQYVVQGRAGSGSWQTLETVGNVLSWEHVDPNPSVTWSYRIAAVASQPWTLTSAYSSASNVVQLLAAPNAPTLLAPVGVADRDKDITFQWRHNPVDTTEQVAYELRYRLNGGAWVTLTGSTASTRTLAALGVSGTVEWQVRTKGAHPDWSPWSAIGSFSLAGAPTVAINAPDGGTLDQSRVTLTVGYAQADGSPQSRVQAELVHGGRVIETLTWTGTGDTRAFKTALDDDAEYTVRARVQAGNGLWSDWDEVTFTTDFPVPVAFEPDAVWDRATGAITVGGHQLDMLPGQIMADSITIQRRDSEDSPWVTLAEDVDPGTEITDPLPALGTPEYRIISHTSLPSSNTGEAVAVPWVHGPHDLVYVNTGPGYELVGTARGNQASDDYSIEQSSFQAAGIDLPIAIFGTSETGSLSFTGRIFDPRIGVEPVTTRDEWRALLRHRQVVCYRDCQGRKMFGLLHVSFSQQGPVETVQITVDEVWHEEGVVA